MSLVSDSFAIRNRQVACYASVACLLLLVKKLPKLLMKIFLIKNNRFFVIGW